MDLDKYGLGFKEYVDPESNELHEAILAHGYVYVMDYNEGTSYLHPETERYMLGWPVDSGVNLSLWDNFWNEVQIEDGNVNAAVTRFTELFTELWNEYAEELKYIK